ncbi:unnamed protein product [Triticum turgidum subsp. durum]|uniref:Uncharacterized protein n=1 Tax=Triticum turgidum subsp. durum TaxID=4567 RepID=A0A9R1Q114_TRITD|nr:unnamed protein product [Triticum turgidum subsp. durum]
MALAAAASSVGVASVALLLLLIANASASDASLEARRALPGREIHLEPIVYPENAQSTVGSSPWRRSAEETPPSPANNSLVLAAKRTRRNDPSANNTMYGGGWNISEMHYWAVRTENHPTFPHFVHVALLIVRVVLHFHARMQSVGYTGVPFFFLALVWFVGFGVVMLVISCCWCCCCFCRDRSDNYSPASFNASLILLVILTIATIVGCLLLNIGQMAFHTSTTNTVDYVVGQGNLTVDNLRNFAGSLAAAKNIGVDQIFLPVEVQRKIDVVEEKLNSSANEFSARIVLNSDKIKNVVDLMLVIAGWVFVTVTLMMAGGFVLLHNVVGDTCVAMDEWVTHPQDHTALDDILPCVDVGTANESMHRSEEVTAQLVALVNNVIVNISNRDFPPGLQPLYFNQSGPKMPVLCNPLKPDMSPRECASGEVDFKTAPGEWKKFQCQAKGPAGKETFTSISVNNCPGLRYFSRTVYHGLILVSASVMVSIVCWMVHTRQRSLRGKQE